jgi:hypothetical protein
MGAEAGIATLRDLRAARDQARKEYLAVRATLPDAAERGRLWREFLEANDAYLRAKGQAR